MRQAEARNRPEGGLDYHPLYGVAAPAWGWVPSPRYCLRRARVLALLDELPRGPALEVGCGAGALLCDLAARGFACTALEPSASAREVARRVARAAAGAIHDVAQAHWRDAYALVLALEVLEHIPDDLGALVAWQSWLTPGGHLVLSVPARMARWQASDVRVGHVRRYERAELIEKVGAAGLEILYHECYGFPLGNWSERLGSWLGGRASAGRTPLAPLNSKAERSLRSGIDRGLETRLYPFWKSFAGRSAFRVACLLQARFARRDIGTGYLLLARRPP